MVWLLSGVVIAAGPKISGVNKITDDLPGGAAGSVNVVYAGNKLSGSLGQISAGTAGFGADSYARAGYFSKMVSSPVAAGYFQVFVTSVSVQWTTASPIDPQGARYTAEVSTAADFTGDIVAASSPSSPGHISGLSGGTTYYARVWVSYMEGDSSGYYVVAPTATLPALLVPAAPGNLSAESIAGNKIKLSWEPSTSTGTTGYNLYFDSGTGVIDYGSPFARLASTDTVYTTDILTSSAAYKFGLRAVMAGVEEENTDVTATAASLGEISGIRAAIKIPQTGKKVSGNRLTVMAEIILGTSAGAREVLFQYKASTAAVWLNIPAANGTHPNPDSAFPYFVHWDISAISPTAYDLRAVALDIWGNPDQAPPSITVTADAVSPDITENSQGAGKIRKDQKVNNAVTNFLHAGDEGSQQVTGVYIPSGALSESTVTVSVSNSPAFTPLAPPDAQGIGVVSEITLSNSQHWLSNGRTATIALTFPDADEDGVVDGTGVRASTLKMYSAESTAGPWVRDFTSTVNIAAKTVSGNTPHFSFFSLFAPLAADLNAVRVYPNPWRPGSGGQFDSASGITFDNLTATAQIRIFTITGQLVRELQVVPGDGGAKLWDGRNSGGHKTASGVYLAHIKSASGTEIIKVAVER